MSYDTDPPTDPTAPAVTVLTPPPDADAALAAAVAGALPDGSTVLGIWPSVQVEGILEAPCPPEIHTVAYIDPTTHQIHVAVFESWPCTGDLELLSDAVVQ
jgi:sugar (pentulose or hexulose) kinase